ncbi:hypothetical protein [Coxiella endosymbiont of Ornithodoros maritimus]|uniref:hypothetical protein n=1 Tax=Coxiella endosymbiont of Ornithodoros maritimus TaxID=1656172 RepID=UPI0022641626|nr:hypothetical protein [Coxiella endosymbiont of Ornithodoros maritimus]
MIKIVKSNKSGGLVKDYWNFSAVPIKLLLASMGKVCLAKAWALAVTVPNE